VFTPLPDKPDHAALELDVLELWQRERTFERLRERNQDGPRFSFIDGPVTANKSLGVHTAWGRTLKDASQRYKALRGYHQRYQNGFDCQGLWIEVGVERELGLDSKREIEEYGLAEFARRCRGVVEWSSAELTKGSIRLGQWMDWGRDYFTFSDTNIEYIWRFLAIVHERGWLYRGQRVTEWCPRCGTSLSAHEMAGSYVDRDDPSLYVRFPLVERPGEALVIWTTTPWTLPANVAAAVRPDAAYGRTAAGEWLAVDTPDAPDFVERRTGADLVGWRYDGPFDALGPGADTEHRVVAWDEVAIGEGTGIVHIAPGCGVDDFEVGRANGLAVLSPVDEAGAYGSGYGWLAGLTTTVANPRIVDDLRGRGLLVRAGTIHHRYPECWRCHTPIIFRVADDWFIGVDEVRDQLRDANATVTWIPAYMGKRMDDWLVNMADWNISRRRYYGLPLPFYPCACGHLTVVRSRADLAARATTPLDGLEELRRPWIDAVRIRCDACGDEVTRIPEVGDVWLDAGIVPFSTLGWQNAEAVPGGYGTGAAKGLTEADLPDHDYWTQWFPADWVSEMREQIRLWFYSQLFMSVTLVGVAPFRTVLGYEKMLDERGRAMHGSHGNMISADEAFARMGADVMRWQYCAQPPSQDLLFGFSTGLDVQRRLLTLWNSVGFLVQYANTTDFAPSYEDLAASAPGDSARQLDRWALARTAKLVRDATDGYDAYLTGSVLRAFEEFVDDLSNWYIRRSRRRFWDGDREALRVLWIALVQGLRVVAPIMPFLTEHLWQRLVVSACPDAPDSVFLAGWPEAGEVDADLLADVAEVRAVVDLGRQARATAQLKLRQPLRRLLVEGADRIGPYLPEIAEELRVKTVVVEHIEATQLRVRPNLPVLGPRLGREVGVVRAALEAGDFRALDDGGFEVAGHRLAAEDVLVQRTEKDGWAVAHDGAVTVALDTSLDDDLRREGRVYETIHQVNGLRKEAGLAITDRITLALPRGDADLAEHRAWIAAEVLAVSVDFSADYRPELALVASGSPSASSS
jgi:isoleucyl-tRNA synthetase